MSFCEQVRTFPNYNGKRLPTGAKETASPLVMIMLMPMAKGGGACGWTCPRGVEKVSMVIIIVACNTGVAPWGPLCLCLPTAHRSPFP